MNQPSSCLCLETPGAGLLLLSNLGFDRNYGEAFLLRCPRCSRHFQSVAGKPALVHRLLAYLRSWNVSHIVADATGVGEGLCDWLASSFGQDRVTQYKFSRLTKVQLGAGFLSVVETGRFAYWDDDADVPLSDGWWFWQQCGHCIYEIKPGGTWERDLQWAVLASARVDTPAGLKAVHDDRLVSAALVSVYDELVLAGALRTGRGEAAVIKGGMRWRGWGFKGRTMDAQSKEP